MKVNLNLGKDGLAKWYTWKRGLSWLPLCYWTSLTCQVCDGELGLSWLLYLYHFWLQNSRLQMVTGWFPMHLWVAEGMGKLSAVYTFVCVYPFICCSVVRRREWRSLLSLLFAFCAYSPFFQPINFSSASLLPFKFFHFLTTALRPIKFFKSILELRSINFECQITTVWFCDFWKVVWP